MHERERVRRVYCVLNARALPYAEKCIQSLFLNVTEPVSLTLITDSDSDRQQIRDAVSGLRIREVHRWAVYAKAEADERARQVYNGLPNLQAFRCGHPCWRKLTDPPLFANPEDEMIILDPDLYFPNQFAFEATLERGLQLMWQRPSCLLPDEVVMRAYGLNVTLAHHVDIGVAQLRNCIDLAWFDWLVGS